MNRILLNSESAPTATGGQNGAGSQDPRAVLAEMLTQRDAPLQPVNETSPTESADDSPENTPAPVQEEEPGQDNLTPEETAPAETETPVEAETENEDEPNAAKEYGTRKRINELTARQTALLQKLDEAESEKERLAAEVEELKASPAVGSQRSETPLPENVAKLRTPAEVQARLEAVKREVKQLKSFLDLNPGHADTVHEVGERQITRQQLVDWRESLEAEMDALPQRGQEIVRATEFVQNRKALAIRTAEEFPQLKDPENPDTKMARQLMKNPQFANVAEADYLALALAVGNRVLQAEKAARSKSTKPLTMTAKPANGKVPTGKPHAANGSAGSRGTGDVKSITARHATERSSDSFAALLSASGR